MSSCASTLRCIIDAICSLRLTIFCSSALICSRLTVRELATSFEDWFELALAVVLRLPTDEVAMDVDCAAFYAIVMMLAGFLK